ncbi:polysaccharide biosynthesis tyrosine autokinase [Sporolactobacillus shoreae]|uniref:non-specific protein-tyrosine kinase n=1 Tax=Sporolactobacillus shoreae TaxID=1465501 RepID=A0A4Z0GTE6_9BACL|nr:CpsD/CapB family tyrosine-protein kinase [Sporolactobacillus shoreae]TGA99971.1 polysaccharide biosynthesis tyrosine autokinase [Sporolactobacillus shoreae]
MRRRMNRGKRKTHPLIAYFRKDSSFSEQYRTLRTNLSFAKAGGGMKTYMVTSAEKGDGKSTTASNLAIVMAQQGKEVLLIDADIRKPSQHYSFRTENQKGLTNLLTAQDPFDEVLQSTVVDHLTLLSSGPAAPNPADLLSSEDMAGIIEQAKERFDQVIIDSPPALAVADARLLANLCDGILLVVRSGSTEIDHASRAAEVFSEVRSKLLGVVLNDKKIKKRDQYDYYYGDR